MGYNHLNLQHYDICDFELWREMDIFWGYTESGEFLFVSLCEVENKVINTFYEMVSERNEFIDRTSGNMLSVRKINEHFRLIVDWRINIDGRNVELTHFWLDFLFDSVYFEYLQLVLKKQLEKCLFKGSKLAK